ncbi:hypothetical protein FPZ42_07310 [Mucilaginibacter achroorhodeus]|uniref:Uncharacterized protein n=1 Tax=Mucilaginibacter achroorhodeus TaxID=2599294 RepID=A0A563U671_9SPHI|nr:hypothetical protein [Mucilaginibacter achroorhodeus]TWR26838.1 hypothetical protein FPZ42_07310 [Mucilaginibacter achroorhodeus]
MYFVDFFDNPINATAANTNGYLGKLGLESNPAANVNIETNDETVGRYDQTDFGTYQQNSTWPMVNPVIHGNKFISYDQALPYTSQKTDRNRELS